MQSCKCPTTSGDNGFSYITIPLNHHDNDILITKCGGFQQHTVRNQSVSVYNNDVPNWIKGRTNESTYKNPKIIGVHTQNFPKRNKNMTQIHIKAFH